MFSLCPKCKLELKPRPLLSRATRKAIGKKVYLIKKLYNRNNKKEGIEKTLAKYYKKCICNGTPRTKQSNWSSCKLAGDDR